jgi:hypothetical protein
VIVRLLPQMIPKAYRFVGEMEEVGGFVGADSHGARTFEGLAGTFGRVASARAMSACAAAGPDNAPGDVELLLKFAEMAQKTRAKPDV